MDCVRGSGRWGGGRAGNDGGQHRVSRVVETKVGPRRPAHKQRIGCSTTSQIPRRSSARCCEMLLVLSKLGGYFGSQGDGKPGVTVLWRGRSSLYETVETLSAHKHVLSRGDSSRTMRYCGRYFTAARDRVDQCAPHDSRDEPSSSIPGNL